MPEICDVPRRKVKLSKCTKTFKSTEMHIKCIYFVIYRSSNRNTKTPKTTVLCYRSDEIILVKWAPKSESQNLTDCSLKTGDQVFAPSQVPPSARYLQTWSNVPRSNAFSCQKSLPVTGSLQQENCKCINDDNTLRINLPSVQWTKHCQKFWCEISLI